MSSEGKHFPTRPGFVVLTTDRWDDDVVFKNQARGTEDKRKKEFVNVSSRVLREDDFPS